jgi:ATP-dependent exoDNAse (exonuclease V) beta subunit
MSAADKARLSDAQQRERALDAGSSFIVQAPAGSGKTELLTQRFLKMLLTVNDPEEVLAITFTRKAAAEMRSRILRAIFPESATAAEKRLPVTAELAREVLAQDKQRNWRLRDNPARLRIRTIDSVNSWLSSTTPLASGAAGNAVTEIPADLYRHAALNTLQLVSAADADSAAVRKLLAHLDNSAQRFVSLVGMMLGTREQWLGHVVSLHGAAIESDAAREALETCLAEIVTAEILAADAHLDNEQKAALSATLRRAAENIRAVKPDSAWHVWEQCAEFPAAASAELRAWQLLAEFLLTQKGTPRQSLTKNNGFPAGTGENKTRKDAALALIAEVVSSTACADAFALLPLLPEPAYSDSQWDMLVALFVVLKRAAAELTLVFRERNVTDYPAIASAALTALEGEGGPTDLALRLDYTISHILIDEFQDTSTMQLRLLEALTGGWQQDDGRTLFIVGDPMQSIYRFRQAEVGLFIELQNEGLDNVALQPLRLTTNFRSDPAVVKWVNDKFSLVLGSVSDITRGSVAYAPGAAARESDPAAAVQLHPFAWPSRYDEAQHIAALIKTSLKQWPDQSIGVLVRSRVHAGLLVDALRARQISFSGTGLENTLETQVIQDLLCLTRALSHAADRTAWLGLLRAPWCGLTLADLEALAGADHHAPVWELLTAGEACARLSADGRQRVQRVVAILQPVLSSRGSLALRDIVEGVWLELGGPACLTDSIDADRARSFFTALDNEDKGGDCADPFALHSRLAEQLTIEDREAQVNIMTIHKAKGLEFDTVILPSLEAGVRGDNKPPIAWQEVIRPDGEAGLIMAPIEATGDEAEPIFALARRQNNMLNAFESDRLLYVAATRARERLHLCFGLRFDKDGLVRPPAKNSLLARLWPAIGAEYAEFTAEPGTEARLDSWVQPGLTRFATGWAPAGRPERFELPDTDPAPSAQTEISYDWAGAAARHIGSVTHRWLQFIAEENLKDWTAEDIEAQRVAIDHMLAEHGVTSIGREAACNTVVAALTGAISQERGRWLLFADHAEARTELELYQLRDGRAEKCIIDRTFIDAAGERWIIDYKTSSHTGGDLDTFIASEIERYAPQLHRYRDVFAALEPDRTHKLALYFPLLDVFREL